MIVIVSPKGELSPSVSERLEDFLFEKLVSEPTIEALDQDVLGRHSRCDIVPVHAGPVLPVEHGPTGEFAAIVGNDRLGPTVEPGDPIKFPGNTGARDRGVSDQTKALACAVVDQHQNAEAPVAWPQFHP